MSEEITPVSSPTPTPATTPTPTPTPTPAPKEKKKGGWFQRVPKDILLSPGGITILFLVIIIETIGILIPIPIIGFIIQLPFVIFLYILLMTVAKLSFKSLIIVPIIEFFLPFLPTWLIRILL